MENNDILYLSDLNMIEFIRENARWNTKSEIVEQDDLLLVAGADPSPVTNFAVRLNCNAAPPANDVLERARVFFSERNRLYSIQIRQHFDADLESACKDSNLTLIMNGPGMAINAPLPEEPVESNIEIKQVVRAEQAADFAKIVIGSYQTLGMPVETGKNIFATPERMIRPYNYSVVAYLNGEPVSCAMIILSHSIAGVYWVGTLENARGKGLAKACTRAVGNEAFKRGVSRVVLQASPLGEPVYKRMGYEEFTRYPWYMSLSKE